MPFADSQRHTTNKALSCSWAHAPALGSPQDELAHKGDVPNFIKYHCFAKTNNPSLKSQRHRRYRNRARALHKREEFMQDARAGLRRGHRTKVAAYSRPCLCLDTHLTIGSIARLRTNIQATTTAQVNAIAPDGTTTSRKSGTTSTTLRDKATAKSDHSGQFFIADDNRVPSL